MDLKGKKKLKPRTPKTTKQEITIKNEANRIQTKLETLKEQIQLKKKSVKDNQANQQKVEDEVSKFLKTNEFPTKNNQLLTLIKKFKAENYLQNINQKGITSLDQFLILTQSQIDEWKDIPVGFRIKMKKFLNQHQKTVENVENQSKIEDIIKERSENRKFIPLSNRQQETQEIQQLEQSVEDYDEDFLIESLNKVFNPRKSILKNKYAQKMPKNEKKVHWDESVEQYNKETSNFKGGQKARTVYPLTIKKVNKLQYCWNCLKRVQEDDEGVHEEGRVYCSEKCWKGYKGKISLQMEEEEDEGLDLCIL